MIKKILVSQPKPSSEKSPYYDIANKFDVELVFRPFIKVEGISAKEFRAQKVNILDYTAIVFTSRHAIDHFFTLAKDLRVAIPEDMKYFCVTETISLYIQKYVQYRKRKVFFGTTGKIDDLIPTMAKHKTEKYLVPMSDVHNDTISKMLTAKKLNFKECVMYRTVSNDFIPTHPLRYAHLLQPCRNRVADKEFPQLQSGRHCHSYLRPGYSKGCQGRRTKTRPGGTL